MKKNTSFIIFMLCMLSATAQSRDTIGLGYPNYMFNAPIYGPYDSLYIMCQGIRLGDLAFDNGRYFAGYTYEVPQPQVIYGIAMGVFSYHDTNIAPNRSFSAVLKCHDTVMGFVTADSVAFHQYPGTKYFDVGSLARKTDTVANLADYLHFARMVEFYFDTPITVNGSFAVGATSKRGNPAYLIFVGARPRWHYGSAYINSTEEYIVIDENTQSMLDGSNDYYPLALNPNAQRFCWPLLFPIVVDERDTVPICIEEVRGFQFSRIRLGNPVFAYDSLDGQYNYEFQYVPYGRSWADATTFQPEGSPFTVWGDFDSTTMYKARMRTSCHHACATHDTLVPGEWGEEILFHTGIIPPDDTTGIARVAKLAVLFTLTPNPTTGKVTVTVGHTPQSRTHSSVSKADSSPNLGEQLVLTLRDAAGHEVLRKELSTFNSQLSTTLDLSSLPAGAYFVTLTTPTASSTQRLVVK